MQQTALPLDLSQPTDRVGFELGMDHARYGLAPTPASMRAGAALHEGWLAGRAVFGARPPRSTRAVRSWLAWRTQAWIDGVAFDAQGLNPATLDARLPLECPVTRRPLGGLPGSADAPVLCRLGAGKDYAAERVAWVSQAAADGRPGELDDAALPRRASLHLLVTPVPHVQALRCPLRVLPPAGVAPVNAAHRLQVWLTLELAAPGWSGRLRQMAELIEDPGTRQDFQLLIGALAPRALELPPPEEGPRLRHALEDLWQHPRVQQRWRTLGLALGEAGTLRLLARAAAGALRTARASTRPADTTAVTPRRWPAPRRGAQRQPAA